VSDDAPEPAIPDLTAVEADLNAVDRALQRLDEGVYGRCAVCGESIAGDRLELDPLAERCDVHAAHGEAQAEQNDQTAWASGGVASN
jgi:RNA polymerase-binding transcription factor DksA